MNRLDVTTVSACVAVLASALFAVPRVEGQSVLDTQLTSGETTTIVPAGGTFNVTIALTNPLPMSFNAVLFRLVFTIEGCQVLDYGWHAPFVTNGPTDFSLEGLMLPATIDDDTLVGPGYPSGTADAEFGVFDFVATAHEGPLLDLVLRAPLDARPGSSFFVVAYPELCSNGFDLVTVEVGLILTVEIANSEVYGDVSGDGVVNSIDLALLLGNWGGVGTGDLNNDGAVNQFDLGILLGAWG